MSKRISTDKTRVQKLPVIGHVTIPVHVMHTPDGFQSGFAFMKFADHQADLYDDKTDKRLGRMGGTIGAHTEFSFYDDKEENEAQLIVDTAEFWNAVCTLFESPEGQAKVAEITKTAREKREAEDLAKLEEEIAELEAEEARLAEEDGNE